MFDKDKFKIYLQSLKADNDLISRTVDLVSKFQEFSTKHINMEETKLIETYSDEVISGSGNEVEKLVGLARYCKFTGNKEGLIYLLSLFNSVGVIESFRNRAKLFGFDDFFSEYDDPSLGIKPEKYLPKIEKALSNVLKTIPHKTYRKILASNHHQIPIEVFNEDKKRFIELGSIDKFLEYRHYKMISEMENCLRENRLWFEQNITREVLDFVKSNQEIQAGIRKDNRIYVTKIPSKVDKYLNETDKRKRRYLSCHCPFVRDSIIDENTKISSEWCYCTGGFEKLIFDVIYDQELEVELLESVLDENGSKCRFAIVLPKNYLDWEKNE
ncbi:MAG: hypothetical protein JXR48_04830 [Candidatus Delongbacteria bacterium]|nr:hypothetical protein [Candidatus Delongbacteria bacterium]MBN2834273.1 hypothetical protein [Candidatus Delongbacteria bacterium]